MLKKIYRFFLLAPLVLSGSDWLNAQCTVSVSASDTLICAGDTVTLTAVVPENTLPTTYAAGNNHRGNMFDLTAINDITITSFDAHPMGNTTIEIYYKTGTYAGNEANTVAWTLIGSAAVTAQPTGNPTPVPVPVNITIPAGQTYAFYVTSTNTGVSLNYTNGSSAGNVFASDANLQFKEGVGLEYPFTAGGSIFSPRVWNGTIHYTLATDYTWTTGDTTPTIMVTPTSNTTYGVVTMNNQPCTAGDSLAIMVNPAPSVSLGADTTICNGDSLTFDAGAGYSYSWSNGGSGQMETFSSAGPVSVVITDSIGCSGNDTMNLGVQMPMTVDIGPDTSVCNGQTVTLDAGAGAGSYSWSTGDTTQFIVAGNTGMYIADVTDPFGCFLVSDTMMLSVTGPTVALGGDTTFCGSTPLTLDAGAGGSGYAWSTGDSSQSIMVSTSGSYSVMVTDSAGCSSSDTITVTAETMPVAGFTFAPGAGLDVTFTNTSTGGGSCVWDFGDGDSSTDANPTHTYGADGTYTVTLTCSNSCGSDSTSQTLMVVAVDPATDMAGFRVYPNPSTGIVYVDLPEGSEEVMISVTDILGKEIYHAATRDRATLRLDLPANAKGVVFLSLQSQGRVVTKKLILE